MPEQTGERKGLISASSLEQAELCPGSWEAQQGLPDRTDEYSESGTKVHDALAKSTRGETVPKGFLNEEELDVFDKCVAQRHYVVNQWLNGGAVDELIVEKRLWWNSDELNYTGYFSGKADYIAISGHSALVLDYKTLWGKHDDSINNRQLMGLAVLLKINKPHITSVRAVIIQPNLGKPSIADYDELALSQAHDVVGQILDRAYATGARRHVGDRQCKYCLAAGAERCPESRANLERLGAIEIHSRQEPATDQDLAWLVGRAKAAKALIGHIETEAKRRLKEGARLVDKDGTEWILVPNSPREKITDVYSVWQECRAKLAKVYETGLGSKSTPGVIESMLSEASCDFIGKTTITKENLKKFVKDKMNVKGKELDEVIEDVTFGNTESKEIEPSIERKET